MISWIVLVVGAIILTSIGRVFQKSIFIGSQISSELSSTLFQFGAAVVIGTFAILGGLDFSGLSMHVPSLILMAFIYAGVNYFLFKAYKQSEGSIVTILLSTNAIWMILGSAIFLREDINVEKIIGILLIISTTIILGSESGKFKLDRKLFFPLIGAMLLGLGFVNDAYILGSASLLTYLTMAFLFPGILSIVFLIPEKKYLGIKTLTRTDYFKTLILSLFYSLGAILVYYSYKQGADASVVGPMQQLTVLGTVILSYIFLNERKNLARKLLATVLAIAGGVILTLA